MKYDQITVLIPAYKPDEKLVKLVDDLIAAHGDYLPAYH